MAASNKSLLREQQQLLAYNVPTTGAGGWLQMETQAGMQVKKTSVAVAAEGGGRSNTPSLPFVTVLYTFRRRGIPFRVQVFQFCFDEGER